MISNAILNTDVYCTYFNKKDSDFCLSLFYGASSGTRHEPTFAILAQQCMEETEIMTRLEKWCKKLHPTDFNQ